MSAEPANEPDVIVDERGPLLVVRLNRPRVRNALTRRMAEHLAGAFERLDREGELRVGVVTGTPPAFCSGMDLAAFARGERASWPGRGFGGLTERPPAKPLIAAVEGAAVGGGFEMVLACDLVVAADDATFGLPEVRRGLVAAAGGLLRLPRAIPPAVAMEMALTGDPIDAWRAYTLGLVNHVVEPGTALAAACALGERIAAHADQAVLASKRVLARVRDGDFVDAYRAHREELSGILDSSDARAGARAFVRQGSGGAQGDPGTRR
ncbi:crotonase/enoyl-CoA hydratase family protein [Streptomyces dubilierae]|uniref:Crotonase/enoyl-CoA hydratase family protein n=1 Tax=Streptomyces dubilierae TaxID=3075533 RepID=A0ABU2PL44_9ACTN|nr:crotonase/enoyl-CoA hydratase family protein [Streptomyces sp. DSM 41921]MDT0392060.1 crotonase/enoyl-CoA hydratase family protein [Streptomyces sp. DSM 41921]